MRHINNDKEMFREDAVQIKTSFQLCCVYFINSKLVIYCDHLKFPFQICITDMFRVNNFNNACLKNTKATYQANNR